MLIGNEQENSPLRCSGLWDSGGRSFRLFFLLGRCEYFAEIFVTSATACLQALGVYDVEHEAFGIVLVRIGAAIPRGWLFKGIGIQIEAVQKA